MHYSSLNDIDFPFVRTHPIARKAPGRAPPPPPRPAGGGGVGARLTLQLGTVDNRCYSPPP